MEMIPEEDSPSKPFRIERDFINFLIGGGMSEDTYIELLVGEAACSQVP